MSFPTYPAYKDSGVEWLGEVPEHWSTLPAKRIFRNVRDSALPLAEQLASTQAYGVIPQKQFMERAEAKVVLALAGTDNFKDVRVDDFVISLRSFQGGIEHSAYEGCVSPAYTVLRNTCNHPFCPGYFKYLLKERSYISALQSVTTGIREGRTITYDQFGSLLLPVVPLVEQAQVSRFLDYETARIDALIAEQQRLIELLKEKRQAVISHAVTKGLDPTVPMKDSGVEWLGEVPAHWVVRRIKHLTEVISKGTTPTTIGEDFQGEGVRFLKAENIFGGRVLPDPEFFISERAHAALARSALAENDVLVVIAGATTGKSAVLSGDLLPANTNQAVSFIRLRDTRLSEFIQCWLSTDAVQRSISLNSVQSAQPNLSMEDLGEIPVPLPPLDEIDLITDQMATQISIFDGLISEAVNASGLLQERRSALISAAVTGKIDVRNW